MERAARIRVVVDTRIPARGWGGVQQVAIGLASGLTSIAAADLDVLYLCYPDGPEWLRPYVESGDQFKFVSAAPAPPATKAWAARHLAWARGAYHAMMSMPPVPRSDGTLEALAPDIVHFPHQDGFLTDVTSVYQPHDLQHLHLPKFFTKREIMIRETRYRAFCAQAALVAMATSWGRDDILRAYGLPADKVALVPLAPVIDRYPEPSEAELRRVRADLQLPTDFCFYPAQTWPHKNHERLLRAVAQLRQRRGIAIPLVFSGAETPYRKHLIRVIDELGIGRDVRWVGFVSPSQVRALYRLARVVVVPSLFESASQPVFEALSSGVAIACSNVTATPRLVGEAALVFDPYSVDEIAAAIERLWTDPKLREDLVNRGKARVAEFSWERTARLFAAHYRRLAGRDLSGEDQALLVGEPII